MNLLPHDWLVHLYYELQSLDAGVKKHFLPLDDKQNTIFSYYEKGVKIPGQSSMVFVHGFSSNKESWLTLMGNISNDYHCIMIDLPCHGETTGLIGDDRSINTAIDKIKMFLDKMNLLEPIYMIGASIGGTVVSMFTTKYPEYVSMICLLAPPPTKEYESDLIRKLRSGMDHILLPETPEQFYAMADLLTVKKVTVPKAFVHKYFKSRLRILDEQKKLLQSFLDNDYTNLEKYYEELKYITCPALIIWGRQDQLCKVESAEYFSNLISDSNVIIFDECGHFISSDKPKETAKHITTFLDLNSYCIIENIE